MELLETPFPALGKGQVMVRNHFSLISSGTEGKTVKDARLGYIGKARSRKDEVKKVVQAARTYGVMNTYKMVMNKLDAPSSLGYSCAGSVIAVADDVRGFRVGDMVACGGATASHAEVVAVPVNLCAKFDDRVKAEHAAFTTVGAIAMQGIRQADLRIGENCVIIGLGLVGQLTARILNAGGIRVAGIDIDEEMVSMAAAEGCEISINRNEPTLEQQIQKFTDGHGTDAVIITAGASTTDPVDLAGALCRKKGKVVIVGGVPTGFKRPNYFRKELDLKMSASYGPGRYDQNYEDLGIDYPYGYVRWTENRNMMAFIELIASGRISLDTLLTHRFRFSNAVEAYDLMISRKEPFVGIVLEYDTGKELSESVRFTDNEDYNKSEPNIGMIGAGSFGQNFLLPAIKGHGKLVSIATARPNNAVNIASKFGFDKAAANADELNSDPDINTVFIATRHDTHAHLVIDALQNGKNVFVEKPLCMTRDELSRIISAYTSSGARLMIGFNRRFSPFIKRSLEVIPEDFPVSINYRINAGTVPTDHWIHNPMIGGGRIIGEVCHFLDLAMHISGSPVTSVSANSMNDAAGLNDTLNILMRFENGSTATISYFSNGNKSVSKEYLEIFAGGTVITIDDFRSMNIHRDSSKKLSAPMDKGHRNEVRAFLESINDGLPAPIPFNELILTTHATFCVIESIASGGEKIDVRVSDLLPVNRTAEQ